MSCGQLFGKSCEVIGDHCQDEFRTDTLDAAILCQSHAADGFHLAECLFDLLSMLLG